MKGLTDRETRVAGSCAADRQAGRSKLDSTRGTKPEQYCRSIALLCRTGTQSCINDYCRQAAGSWQLNRLSL